MACKLLKARGGAGGFACVLLLDEALAVVKTGGFYVIDDMLPQPNWPEGHAEKVPILLDRLSNEPTLEIIPMQWASGVVVAVKRYNRSYYETA